MPSLPTPSARPLRALAVLLLVLALGLSAAAPGALAAELGGNNALSELTESNSESTTTTTAKTATTSESSGSSTTEVVVLALAVALILMSVIAWVIIRDARKRAPVDEEDVDAREARAAHDQSIRLQKRRAKAKAARAQRKRTR